MNNKQLIIGAVVLILLIVGGIYIFSPSEKPEPETYNQCVAQILDDLRTLKPASEEAIGAKRTDDLGEVWTKSDEPREFFTSEGTIEEGYIWKSEQSQGSILGDEDVDEFQGGASYLPEDSAFKECEKYIGTVNLEYKESLQKLMNSLSDELLGQGITISLEEIDAGNTLEGIEGKLEIDIDGEIGNEVMIIKIQQKLMEEYPMCFSEDSDCEFEVEVRLSYGGERDSSWMIFENYYDMAV